MASAQSNRTHCPAGHEYTAENTLVSGGRRHCRACGREQSRLTQERRRRAAGAPPRRVWTTGEAIVEHIEVDCVSACWLWTGSITSDGYGQFGRPSRLAHRMSYEFFVGPIPDGCILDHVRDRGCIHRHCINPDHLESVTIAENVLRGDSRPAQNARKTHCPQGHPYDDENTWISPSTGWRGCRTCNRERHRSPGR